MSSIKMAIDLLDEPSKSIGQILWNFYEQMRILEKDPERGGKQATCIVMAMRDLEQLIEK